MRTFVTGGSGFVGGHLIRRLVADGHDVRALVRSEAASLRVDELGATPVRGDLGETAVLANAIGDSEVVFHCAAVVGTNLDRDLAFATNVEGTANILQASTVAAVRRLVHVSTESVLHDGSPLDGVDESIPIPQAGHLSHYAASKARAEQLVLAANGDSLETIALRPRLVWGPDDGAWLPGLIEKVESGVFRWVDDGVHLGSTCHVYNLVEALILAIEHGTPGEAYFITDGAPRSFKQFASAYLATAAVTPTDKSMPGWLMRGIAAVTETTWRLLPLRGSPPVNRVEAYMVSHPQVFDDTKARTELGYVPVITVVEGLRELQEDATPKS